MRFPLLAFAVTLVLPGCSYVTWFRPKPAPTAAAPTPSKYDDLAAKAEAGDVGAARELAKWCYVHDTDNSRAKYWLEVASRNGDHSSEKVAGYVQDWQ